MLQQPIDRVSHVVYCVKPENLDRAAAFLSEALGAKFEDSSRPELGLRILISLQSGLELIAPSPELGVAPARFTDFLTNHGEGVYDVVYGVRDLDETIERAAAHGVGVTHRGSFADLPPWKGRMDVLDEAHLEPVCGLQLTLGRIEPTAGAWPD
jgi:4-hydroxyphenylpyruvate dioxygenase-like putative hemolysin